MSNRRQFLGTAAALTVAGAMRPSPAADKRKLLVGCVGVHNRGETNSTMAVGEHVVALCDIDERYLAPFVEQHYPKAKQYSDWREMLDKERLEAIVISTPNHTHANIALAAIKKSLHVYIEKPLAHTFEEVRKIEAAAKAQGVVAFMGNQHHASAGYQHAIEILKAGLIGPVKEIHAWTNRPMWKQGLKTVDEGTPVPLEVKWDLWLGPTREHGYSPFYHPIGWRGFWDFGGGALADMGPHLLDPVLWGLELTAPTTISAETAPDLTDLCPPSWSKIVFEFPARGALPPVTLTWYDGAAGPRPTSDTLGTSRPPLQGVMCVGERAKLFIPDLGGEPLIKPNVKTDIIEEPEKRKLLLTRGHQLEWINSCKQGTPDAANFSKACRLTELCHLGNIAIRRQKKLTWKAEKSQFDDDAANQLLKRDYRQGWELPT